MAQIIFSLVKEKWTLANPHPLPSFSPYPPPALEMDVICVPPNATVNVLTYYNIL